MSEQKNAIAEVLGAMLESFEKDDANAFATIANQPLIVRARGFVERGEIDDFYLFVIFPMESTLQSLVRSAFAESATVDASMRQYAEFLFLHGGEIQRHYERLIRQVEGFACCADKSRTIMRRLLTYFIEGRKIEFDYSGEYTYHLPKKVFTTHEEIVEFFHGLHEFHYGTPDRYIKALSVELAKMSSVTADEC